MKAKMTGPRRSLLKELSETPRYVSESYSPLIWLMANGLVEKREIGISTQYLATDAGKLALSDLARSEAK